MRIFRDRAAVALPQDGFLSMVTVEQLRAIGDRTRTEAAIRGRCMVVHVDEHTAVCRILGRYKMYVDLRDRAFVPHLMFEGYWEYWITSFLWRNVRLGMTALDLGANHGYYSILLADLVGEQGRVHAFEPNPRMLELLRDNVAVNGFWNVIDVHGAAVGAAPEPAAPLLVAVKDPKNAHLVSADEAAEAIVSAEQALHRVPVVTLDGTIDGPVDVVKIDIEGSEAAAWRGMQGLIARSPGIAIIVEFNPRRTADSAGILAEMAALFPLREVTFDGSAVPVAVEDVLARSEDTILYLSRRTPD